MAAGFLVAQGPFPDQSFQCYVGAPCIIDGLQGAKLTQDDMLLPLQSCGTSLTASLFPDPHPILAAFKSFNESNETFFDLGSLAAGASPETLQLCWCPRTANCSTVEDFRATAMRLDVVCPPGTYELVGRTTQCHECPPGYFCPGGQAAQAAELRQCAHGSTSARRSSSEQACQCRPGYSWDTLSSSCLPCLIGSYKNFIGNFACQSCPVGTTTASTGAVGDHECFCANSRFGLHSAPDAFNCTDQQSLPFLSATSGILYARTQVDAHVFSGSFEQTGGTASLDAFRNALASHLGLNGLLRASLTLSVTTNSSNDGLDYEVTTSEAQLAAELRAKFDQEVFSAWVFTQHGDTAWASAGVAHQGDVQEQLLVCPDGLAFPPGPVGGQADCLCPQGMEAAAEAAGCQECPLGQFKAAVGNTSCTSCSFGLTTLQAGAVSSTACTCTAGYVSTTPGDPASCEACGYGFFCHGGDHREACPPSTSTLGQAAGSIADCVCATGHFGNLGSVLCEECPAGRFKDSIGTDECQPCPIGTWSNISGANSSAACASCEDLVVGSTTKSNASSTEELCIRPHDEQSFNCTSGALCEVHLDGFHLQDRHRLLLANADCKSNKKAGVSGVANEGISEAASNNGSRYTWNGLPNNFVPDGGVYYLCWCVNMNGLVCADAVDFQISAGQLHVIGPFGNQKFRCVRGQDCTNLHVQGVGLSQGHLVAVRNGCGTERTLQLSPANQNGSGIFLEGISALALSFGSSQTGIDHGVSLDESSEGYDLCWCGVWPCSFQDFVVAFGKLIVEGPRANQQVNCAAGQPCELSDIQGQLRPGDSIMVLAACGLGSAIEGFPGGGKAEIIKMPEDATLLSYGPFCGFCQLN